MNDIQKFLQGKMKFLSLQDGESFVGIFEGSRYIEKNRFGNPTMCYKLKYPTTGSTIEWENGQNKVAREMAKADEGDKVRITRQGIEKNTRYKIEIKKLNKEVIQKIADETAEVSEEDTEVPF